MRWLLASGVVLQACVSGPVFVSDADLERRGSLRTTAPYDEAFDAAWLTLERLDWKVTVADRRAGTLETEARTELDSHEARGWRLDFRQDGDRLTLIARPRVFFDGVDVTQGMRWELVKEDARWQDLFHRVQALLEAWRSHPELTLDRRRGELDAGGLKLLVPVAWTHFELSTDRRTLVVQKLRGVKDGLNPSLVYVLERRRPRPDETLVVRTAVERAFRDDGTLNPTEPPKSDANGVFGRGETQSGPGKVVQPVAWRRWEARSPAFVVRVASACAPEGELSCEADVRAAIESAADGTGRLVDQTPGAVPIFEHVTPER